MKDPDVRPKRVCSPRYAVLKARKGKKLNKWELEDLAKDPEYAYQYADLVLKARFPEAEPAIAKVPDTAFQYAKNVIKGRFPEAEEMFLRLHCDWGPRNYLPRYFIDIAQEPNPLVEKKILATHHGLAIEYAAKCLKARWPAGEKVILEDDVDGAVRYHKEVVKERWPELEDRIIFGKNKGFFDSRKKSFADYLENMNSPVPEIEEKLDRCSNASLLLAYAVKGVRGRLPDNLHQKMMLLAFDPKKSKTAKKYARFIDSCDRRALAYIKGLDDQARKELFERAQKETSDAIA